MSRLVRSPSHWVRSIDTSQLSRMAAALSQARIAGHRLDPVRKRGWWLQSSSDREMIVFLRCETGGILAFAIAGLACSAFLPLSISFGNEFPRMSAVMAGELIAFYQLG